MRRFLLLCTAVISTHVGLSQSLTTIQGEKLTIDEKRNWFNLDFKEDRVYGTSANKLYREIIKDSKPQRKIVVAIIDSGVEIEHEDLKHGIWTNVDEIADNGIDDDNNGYVDDVHGWNFLVDTSGTDIQYENLEATRILRISKINNPKDDSYPKWLSEEMLTSASKIYNEANSEMKQMSQLGDVYTQMDSTIQANLGKDDYTFEEALEMESKDEKTKKVLSVVRTLKIFGVTRADLKEMYETSNKYRKYYLNYDFKPREGFDFKKIGYGNNHYEGPDATHGTHVAGLITANRFNTFGAQGIASDAAEIMALRAVPDGDERDQDVANAIRYAVDNGANIINMSFGKGLSPMKGLVNEAISYATENNVLVVHAAGNDNENNDQVQNFPNNGFADDPKNMSYLTIGASTSEKNKKLIANFSNYGKAEVDLFSPGHEVYSTIPDNEYKSLSGTSMAAPVASGVAALIWAYHPSLTALQVKEILISSAPDLGRKKVKKPGSKDKVRFREIAANASIVNAYAGFMMARDTVE